jgi:hypothetical protein
MARPKRGRPRRTDWIGVAITYLIRQLSARETALLHGISEAHVYRIISSIDPTDPDPTIQTLVQMGLLVNNSISPASAIAQSP